MHAHAAFISEKRVGKPAVAAWPSVRQKQVLLGMRHVSQERCGPQCAYNRTTRPSTTRRRPPMSEAKDRPESGGRVARRRLSRLLRTSTFRLSMLYAALFGASVLLLLAFIYWTTSRVIEQQTRDVVEAEVRGLAEQYRGRGIRRLVAVIEERVGREGNWDEIYLLVDSGFRRLAGNLRAWPPEAQALEDGWIEFTARRAGAENGETLDIRARTFLLPGELRLLVGRASRGRLVFEVLILESVGGALGITLLLGLLGGIVMSRNMLRRVDALHEASRRIMHGDLSRRMPVGTAGDEFDRLSATVNEMLDEIETLMTGLRTLTDSVAHDLRTPLTRLKSRMELALLEGSREPAGQREALQQAIAETDGILRTFNLLMEIARAESGVERIVMDRVDLRAAVSDMVEFYKPIADEKGLALDALLDTDTAVVGHAQFLSQLVANLLDNALKYTERGRIAVTLARLPSGAARLVVDDSGPGIPPDDRQRVLQRFVRLDSSRPAGGQGLGLSLAAGVAALHRAKLELDESPLGGLRAALTFPPAELGGESAAANMTGN